MDYRGESILANYFIGRNAVGGRICFDETGLTFQPKPTIAQAQKVRIDYAQIDRVKRRSTYGIIPNGIAIVTKDGVAHRFVIYHRREVIGFLQDRCLR